MGTSYYPVLPTRYQVCILRRLVVATEICSNQNKNQEYQNEEHLHSSSTSINMSGDVVTYSMLTSGMYSKSESVVRCSLFVEYHYKQKDLKQTNRTKKNIAGVQ